MRVLDGEYRRQILRAATPDRARPTARRLREVLFEYLDVYVRGARFLDLCAGSGAVGIEALSRGASFVTFVDHSAEMCRVVESNLEACGPGRGRAEVVESDAAEFLRRACAAEAGAEAWDAAFFDPHYAADYAGVFAAFASGAVFRRRGGVLAVEHHRNKSLPEAAGVLRRWRLVRMGESCLSFYEQKYSARRDPPKFY